MGLQVFSSNSARFSVIWESHDFNPFFQIRISHRSSDSQAAESRAEFELSICSSKIPNNSLLEIRADPRLGLRAFRFLRHQSPSPRTRPTFKGVAESQNVKPNFMAKKLENENNSSGIFMSA